MTQPHQTDSELEVFSHFVRVSKMDIDSESIRKLHPPAPDIECQTIEGEGRAYELVEFLDQGFHHLLKSGLSTQDRMYQYLDSLPVEDLTRFKALFSNADITTFFQDGCSKNVVRAAIPKIFAELLKFEPGLEGDISADQFSDSKLIKGVRGITINRGGFNGPCFNPSVVGRVGDPCVNIIDDKLSKAESYKTDVPLELIAYISSNPMFPENVWKPRLLDFLSDQDSIAPFRKIWVLDLRTDKIALEWATDNKVMDVTADHDMVVPGH